MKFLRQCTLFLTALSIVFLVYAAPNTAMAKPDHAGNGNNGGKNPGNGAEPQCNDHIDNDGNGFCDYDHRKSYCVDGSVVGDPGCSDRNDSSESCAPSPEICDGLSNDCDELVDEDNVCHTEYYCDADTDGHHATTPSGTCSVFECVPAGCQIEPGMDCMDDRADVNPGVVESCDYDGFDNDCDGVVDECDMCFDGIKNNGETGVDCGGSCQGCDVGQACNVNTDCVSGHCNQFVCDEPLTSLPADCKPLKYDGNNNLENHLNVVFVPSAFNGDMGLFEEKARWIHGIFENYLPFKNDVSKLNIFYVPIESDNIDCAFNCYGIPRLLCCNTAEAKGLSSTCTSGPRQTVVIHNSETYGGAGYISADVATTSVHSASPQVAIHELGHSAFNLGDEYNYQSTSTSSNSANCSNANCDKWADMVGYNGVSCVNNSCGDGQYFTSETTIMKSLSYPFEEVNLRASCCSYFNETGSYPPYCVQFEQFASSQDIEKFCFVSPNSSTGTAPTLFVHQPVMVDFHNVNGEWVKVAEHRVKPGKYQMVKVKGKPKGNIKVDITFEDGTVKSLKFDDTEEIEIPGKDRSMAGYRQIPRETLTLIVETKGKRPIKNVQVGRSKMVSN